MLWIGLHSSPLLTAEDMLNAFYKALRTGLDLLMPDKKVRVNTSDVPWMTQHLSRLYLKGRRPFMNMVLNQLSLSSTVKQLTESENHVKVCFMKPRYKA